MDPPPEGAGDGECTGGVIPLMDVELEIELEEGAAGCWSVTDGQREIPVLVVRSAGVLHAYLNNCPHAGVRLDWATGAVRQEDSHYLRCSMHGALFEPDTGKCVAGPCKGGSLVPVQTETAGPNRLRLKQLERLPRRAFCPRR